MMSKAVKDTSDYLKPQVQFPSHSYIYEHIITYIYAIRQGGMLECMYNGMYECMTACVCMYLCMHACMHACMQVCMHACMSECTHACVQV